jgi:L-asparaginase II
MTNPILVEAIRGSRVESVHRGAVAVMDADGRTVFALGDADAPVFPRSAVKPLQALALVESGAAAAFGYGARELALAQASHGGEPAHVQGVAAMLAAAGLDASALQCGAHPPAHAPSAAALVKAGAVPGPIHNNCSGKHAGFLATSRHRGWPTDGYVAAGHPVQAMVRGMLADLTGVPLEAEQAAIDGCSVPTYPLPLRSLALAFARFGSGAGLSPERVRAARALFAAAVEAPFHIAGTDRFCSQAIAALAGQALIKTGAEGVFCGTLPARGLGIAIKCDDGASRAAQAMMAATLARLVPEKVEALAPWSDAPLHNWRGLDVGRVRTIVEAFRPLG